MVRRRIPLLIAGALVAAGAAQPAQARVIDPAEVTPVVIGYSDTEILQERLAELAAQRAAARAKAKAKREAERKAAQAAEELEEHFAGTAPLNVPQPTTSLQGQFTPSSQLGGSAIVSWTQWGLRYWSGQQNNDMTVTYTPGVLHLTDTGTGHTAPLPDGCTSVGASVGIAIDCQIPEQFAATKMFIEVWPRLGNDVLDARTLPSKFNVWFLADGGNDVFYGGDGDDFFNGAFQRDIAYGGAGNDWLRGGPDSDQLDGGTGINKVVQ